MPKPPAPPKRKFDWHMGLRIVTWAGIFVGVAWGGKEVHSFLMTDARFGFERLDIHGTVYASRARIQSVFAADLGQSVFHLPLAERRRHLLAIDWVSAATVSRVWPNRVVVTVTERHPVAFAKMPYPKSSRHWLALIDDDGVLLALPPKVRFHLPVLSGVTEDQTEEERRLRVAAMEHFLSDLGPQSKDISEINAALPQELRVIAAVDGQGVELWMGDQHFRSRYTNFLQHYAEIRKHSERAGVFDLRLDDRILAK